MSSVNQLQVRGKKQIIKTDKREVISVYLSKEAKQKIRKTAKRHGLSLSAYAGKILEQHQHKEPCD